MTDVEAALEDPRRTLQLDGADLELLGWDESTGTVRARLVLVEAGCEDCVMPRPILEQIVLQAVRRTVSAARHVEIEDPRETG